MNLHDLHELQDVHTYPCLTITLPTHRTRPDNRQDPIRVKNLVTEGTQRLLGEFSKREVAPLLDRLNALVDRLDYEYTLDGLVLAVNHDMLFRIPICLDFCRTDTISTDAIANDDAIRLKVEIR